MNTSYPQLERRLEEALRAWRRSRWQRGLSLALLGLLALLAFVYFVEPVRPFWWWTALIALSAAWFFLLAKFLILPLRAQPGLAQVARFLEEQHPELEDRLATAVEFGDTSKIEDKNWLDRMIRDAITHTAGMNFPEQLQLQFARGWQLLAVAAATAFVFALLNFSEAFQSRVGGYLEKSKEAPPPVKSLQLTPGDAKIPRGATVEVSAVSPQLDLAEATLYLETRRDSWQPNTMSLATQPGHFTHKIFDIRDTLRYYARAGDELSPIYTIIPLDAPEVKGFHMTYLYPAGMGSSSKSESSSGDIYVPAGTTVNLEAIASQPLLQAEIRFADTAFRKMEVTADTVARHKFVVEKDSYYVLRLTNRESLSSVPIEYFIHATPDQAPQITILRPGRDLRPTMLEEVTTEVAVREDYGLRQFDLIYASNNGTPKRHNLLPALTRKGAQEFEANMLLYLEDLGVQPGDFISYYFEAADATQQTSSDLYFLEVRPFEEEFYRALSQGGGGSSPAASLALSQKEIITATWKLEQSRKQLPPEEVQSGSKALAETQESLRESIQQMAAHAKLRSQFVEEGTSGNLAQHLEQATEAMAEAVPLLESTRLKDALDAERRAYHFLLKAEAEIRRRELAQTSSASGSYSQLQSRDELQRLFKDELEKIQSKYETFENNRQQQRDAQRNEAQEKVRELAQRQERLVDLNRRLARENMNEENRRQIERLRREQEQINRDLQQLSRRMEQSGTTSEQASNEATQQALRDAIEEMQRASDSLRRNSPSQAAAEGNRALDRLNRLTEQLQREQTGSLREQLSQLQNDLHQLGEAQEQLQEQLSNPRSADETQGRQWQEQQSDLRQRTERVQEKLRQAQAGTRDRPEEKEIARDLSKASSEMDNRKVAQRMEEAGRALERQDWQQARQQQKEAVQGLRRAESALREGLSRLAETPEEKLNTALQEAHRLRERLEESLQQARNEKQSTPDQNQGASSSSDAQSGTPGAPGENTPSNEELNPENMDWWNENLWSGMRQMEQLQPLMQSDSALGRNHRDLIKGYRGLLQSFRGGDPLRVESIESRLLDPLRRLEAELATRLATLQQQERVLSVRDEQVPPQYREMVEEYFKRLAQKR